MYRPAFRRRLPLASACLLLSGIFLLGIASATADARADETATPAPAPKAIDAAVRDWMPRAKVPGLAMAGIHDGQVQWLGVWGERAPGEPMTVDTVFNVASLTKPLFALTVLHEVADGAIDLDAPLANDWVDPDIADDPRRLKLTARLALSHQTGFQNWRRGDKLTFAFPPGERHEYSGEGYEYLRRALEKRTGQSVSTSAAKHILAPLKLTHTWLGWNDAIDGHLAKGYQENGTPYAEDMARGRKPNAAANLFTTIDNYARFAAWAARGADLPKALLKDMTTAQSHDPNAAEQFGLGWRVLTVNDHIVLSHDGREPGVRTQVFVEPDSGDGLVILTASDNAELLTRPLVRAAFSDGDALMAAADAQVWTYLQRMPAEQVPNVAKAVVGSPSFLSQLLYAVDESLLAHAGLDASTREQARAAIDPFVIDLLNGRVSRRQCEKLLEALIVPKDDAYAWRDSFDSAQAQQWISALGEREEGRATKAGLELPATTLKRYVGDYRMPDNQLLIHVELGESGLEASAEGMPVVKLLAESERLFFMREDDTRFEFIGDGATADTLKVIWRGGRFGLAPREQ